MNKVDKRFLFLLLVFLILFKIIFFLLTKNNFISIPLEGGSDADYYNDYAEGYTNIVANSWPVFLRFLNKIGLYSREFITYIFLILNIFFIPIIVCKLAGLKFKVNQSYYLFLYLICIIYPSLFFYTFDVYRDVFMVIVFLIGCLFLKKALEAGRNVLFIFYFAIAILIGLFLSSLRPYLGYSFLLSLFLWNVKLTKKRAVFYGVFYLLILFFANYMGALSSLTDYRTIFEGEGNRGGSNLGIDFSNPILFIPNFIISFLGQMLGLYIMNPFSAVLLIIETLPFFFMLRYVVKNIKLANSFIRFLVIFFVIYSSVWLIGNDNLGTAVRLRFYNYLVVYISFFYILITKRLLLRNPNGVNK